MYLVGMIKSEQIDKTENYKDLHFKRKEGKSCIMNATRPST
jgi:hypothetical protein